MTLLRNLAAVFWHREERRLRAVWRIGVHTILSFAVTVAFIVGLMLLVVFFDSILGFALGERMANAGPVTLTQMPFLSMLVIPAATCLGVFGATSIAGNFIDRRDFKDFGLNFSRIWWSDFAFGLALGAFLIGLIFLIGWLTGNVRVTGFFQPFNETQGFLAGFVQALVFFIFVGVYEELLSRGYHLINLSEGLNNKPLGKTTAVILAVLVSSGVFGLLHSGNPNASWVSTLNITVAGVVFSLGMIFTGRLAIPIGLHITWNFFLGNVFGFPVSGVSYGATLIAMEATGPDWFTGGAFGPEAGLMGLGAMLLGGLLTLVWLKQYGRLSIKTELAEYSIRDKTK